MRFNFLMYVLPVLWEVKKEKWAYLLAAGVGIIMRLTYPKPDWWPIAWGGLVHFSYALYNKTLKSPFYLGWHFGFCLYFTNIF